MAGEADETDDGVETPTQDANDTSLLDAINTALEPTLPEDGDEPAVTEGDGEDDPEGEGEGLEDAEDLDANGGRNADGTFKAQKKGEAELGADGKPVVKLGADGKPLVAEPAKKADPVNDPIPDEVKGRTRERMTALISTVKTQGEQITAQHQLVDSISSTGATPEEFGALLGYMRWVHSDKPEDLKQAQQLLMSELEGISLKLGEAAPGVDFLAKYPDLQTKVDNGQITTDDAKEIALHRTRTANAQAQTTAKQTHEQTTAQATAERNGAIAELDALGKKLNSEDADYAIKHEILKPILQSLGMLKPSQWKAAFSQAYAAITPAQVARFRQPVAAVKKTGNQPLRSNKVPTGGQQRSPGSLLDAVSAAIDSAG